MTAREVNDSNSDGNGDNEDDYNNTISPSGNSTNKNVSVSDSVNNEALTSNGKTLMLVGDNVYRYFHHEIGVHKVQRVPITDNSGKMQTSTACVTLMPDLDPLSINVR